MSDISTRAEDIHQSIHDWLTAQDPSGDWDIDAIVADAYRYDPDAGVFVQTVTEDEFWRIVERHDRAIPAGLAAELVEADTRRAEVIGRMQAWARERSVDGMPKIQIAAALGVSRLTVTAWLKA